MSSFKAKVKIPFSKSIFNRLLLIDYYSSFDLKLDLKGNQSQDVVDLHRLLTQFSQSETKFLVGEGGAVLRFFLPLILKRNARFELHLGESLAGRNHDELIELCKQSGATVEVKGALWVVESAGKFPKKIKLSVDSSSQFVSGVLLNAWRLKEDLELELVGDMVSKPYFSMTLGLLKKFGLSWTKKNNVFLISKGQSPDDKKVDLEPDMSSAFALAAIAAVAGKLEIKDFPAKSLQADYCFLEVLSQMNIPCKLEDKTLVIKKSKDIKGLGLSLKDAPDLFPVLAVLCASSEGESRLYGAAHLTNKESDRIQAVSDLLSKMGRKHQKLEDGIFIAEQKPAYELSSFSFSSYKDHRIAFAAAVAMALGFKVLLDDPRVINKSFSGFWKILEKGGLNDVPNSRA